MMDRLGPFLLGPNDTPENGIYTGDARELAKAIPDESVDLIFTDPPYPREYLGLWEWLAQESARVLRNGGSCLALTGHAYLDQIFGWFTEHLSYHWLNCFYLPSVTSIGSYWPKKIYIRWKPVLWFTKGKRQSCHFVHDGVSSRYKDKRFHRWGQSEQWAFFWLRQLVTEESIIWDPFVGGGTVSAVCKQLGRKYLAFEIDSDVAEMARERVRNTQMPLFVLEPEQMTLGGD